jgi:hypothetical protein
MNSGVPQPDGEAFPEEAFSWAAAQMPTVSRQTSSKSRLIGSRDLRRRFPDSRLTAMSLPVQLWTTPQAISGQAFVI